MKLMGRLLGPGRCTGCWLRVWLWRDHAGIYWGTDRGKRHDCAG